MSDNPKWQVARLDDIERRGRDIPVREHLGIHAFGINAYTPSENGTLIGEHDEAGPGQEELYIVLDGNATFEVDGETVDAPAGTFVFVRPEARRTRGSTGAKRGRSTATRCVRTASSATPTRSKRSARASCATRTIPASI